MKLHERMKAIRSIRDLKSGSKAVLYTLATYVNADNRAWPSIETIALGAGLSRRAVTTALSNLRKLGYLTFKRRANHSHVITLIFYPPDKQKTSSRQAKSARVTVQEHGNTAEPPGKGPPRVNCIDCDEPFHWSFEQDRCRHCQKIHSQQTKSL